MDNSNLNEILIRAKTNKGITEEERELLMLTHPKEAERAKIKSKETE